MSAVSPGRDGAPERTGYSPAEVGASLGLSARHILNLCNSGVIRSRRFGRRVVIPTEEFEQLMADAPGRAPRATA